MIKIIVENKLANLSIKYVDTQRISKDIFDQLINADTSPTKKFAQWIVEQYIADENILSQLDELSKMISAYSKYTDLFKDYNFNKDSITNFISHVKSTLNSHLSTKEKHSLAENLKEHYVGSVVNHAIYLIPKDSEDANLIQSMFKTAPADLLTYGPALFVVGINDKYLLSFAADMYLTGSGDLIPLKESRITLWDAILSWVYQKGIIKEEIIACVDIFGNDFQGSKLQRVIEQNNPQEVYKEYYSKPGNTLFNIVINPNARAMKDYNNYIEGFKTLGFGVKGLVININLNDSSVGMLPQIFQEEGYEDKVKAYFKRTGLSFDETTFQEFSRIVEGRGVLYFVALKNINTTSGIFIDANSNVIGFLNKNELNYFIRKFADASNIQKSLNELGHVHEDKIKELEKQLNTLEVDLRKIIEQASTLKHYIVI